MSRDDFYIRGGGHHAAAASAAHHHHGGGGGNTRYSVVLGESTNLLIKPPNNTKRAHRTSGATNKSPPVRTQLQQQTKASYGGSSKKSAQDFVRREPGYTANIEHLVFPTGGGNKSKQSSTAASNKSAGDVTVVTVKGGRSRLAEMFALSRHLQQRSVDREVKHQKQQMKNRSMDGGAPPTLSSKAGSKSLDGSNNGNWRRWTTETAPTALCSEEQQVKQRVSQSATCSPEPDLYQRVAAAAAAAGSSPNALIRGINPPSSSAALHMRSTSWDTESAYATIGGNSRGYSSRSGVCSSDGIDIAQMPHLVKYQSLGGHNSGGGSSAYSRNKKDIMAAYHSNSQMSSGELFVGSGNCSRELSPVRWCDREVDGVYLGRSGWVQVQQRSLDENRRTSYETSPSSILGTTSTNTLPQTTCRGAPPIKLADYHCNSEPGNSTSAYHHGHSPSSECGESLHHQRPAYLPLRGRNCHETSSTTPSPLSIPESYSPPSITPIISPPPAFQDTNRHAISGGASIVNKPRYYFGANKPFLPRSDAIVDSDIISPPESPPTAGGTWSTVPRNNSTTGSGTPGKGASMARSSKQRLTPSPVSTRHYHHPGGGASSSRIVQTKSLEDTSSTTTAATGAVTPNRRSQFAQRYIESSSSSSSSMGFRSLDSCVNRQVMPRLSENNDSSIEVGYEDGDEDEVSSSVNMSGISSIVLNSSPESSLADGHHGTTSSGVSAGQQLLQQQRSREKVSPSSGKPSRMTSSQYNRIQTRRSPTASDTASKQQMNVNSSPSSSSSSCCSPPARSPSGSIATREFRRSGVNARKPPSTASTRQSSATAVTTSQNETGSNVQRVKRSRSLQLPEKKSPGSSSVGGKQSLRSSHQQQGYSPRVSPQQTIVNEPNRVVVKIASASSSASEKCAGVAPTKRSTIPRTNHSHEDAIQIDEEVLREAQAVTDFLYGSRSRAAAKALLMQRFNSDDKAIIESRSSPIVDNVFNVYVVSNKKKLHRGATTPTASSPGRHFQLTSPTNSIDALKNPCNSNTCDFWPHCAHRDTLNSHAQAVYSGSVASRISPSYPKQPPHEDTRSSDIVASRLASADGRKNSKRGKNMSGGAKSKNNASVVVVQYKSPVSRSPTPTDDLSTSSSANSSSSSDVWVTTSDRTATKSPRNVKSSEASTPLEDNTIGSSPMKSDTRASRTDDGSGDAPRPGSAPADVKDPPSTVAELQQRSMSLPKSFLSRTYKPSSSGQLTGRRQNSSSPYSTPSPQRPQRGPSPADTAHTAPVTPSHEAIGPSSASTGSGANGRQRSPGGGSRASGRSIKSSSTPHLLEDAPSDRRKDSEGIRSSDTPGGSPLRGHSALINEASKEQIYQSHRNISAGSSSESVLKKFRKTFSLRFHQKKSSKEVSMGGSLDLSDASSRQRSQESLGDATDEAIIADTIDERIIGKTSSRYRDDGQSEQQKHRFGPLVWRSSKERKKKSSNKSARSSKCNSGDSGIQLEMVSGSGGGGSGSVATGTEGGDDDDSAGSQRHSRADDDTGGNETDSPPMAVRRRRTTASATAADGGSSDATGISSTGMGNDAKPARPHSDLVNQILIERFKADLQSRAQRLTSSLGHHQQVRRTNSDLGGRRLLQWEYSHHHHHYNRQHHGYAAPPKAYRRMLSSPSPIKQRPRHAPPSVVAMRSNGAAMSGGTRHLRRSLSQPLDIDKLSPIMRSKISGLRTLSSNVMSDDEHDFPHPLGHHRSGTANNTTSEDDDVMSDSESSMTSLASLDRNHHRRKRSLNELAAAAATDDGGHVVLAEAVWDHVAMEAEELAFSAGEVIEVLDTSADRDWWWGRTNSATGWFPAAFVRLRVSQEDTVEDCLAAMSSGTQSSAGERQLRRRTSVSLLSNEQVRASVVSELVQTEKDFVKVLRDVVDGYMVECKRRTDMFSPEQIDTIFTNIEELLRFQTEFLADLEACIDWEAPHRSCVGDCFLKHCSSFRVYSDYCNSHPMATAALQELYQRSDGTAYIRFFEACRLMRSLPELPLDGHLLTPVQRICKYPLQLAELLKYTRAGHADREPVTKALAAMRDVAAHINERKRRMESLEKLAAWQHRVEQWEGEDLIEVSSQLIHQGDVVRVTTGMWTSNITLFLFDHQIIYCKKDILKRNTYVYKGRICLDTSEIIDVPDGKDPAVGATVRHGLKIYSCVRDKWLLFCCRTPGDKQRWLNALTEERRLVARDKRDGLDFPPAARQLARMAARRQRRPPSKPRSGKNYKRDRTYGGSQLQLNSHHHHHSSVNNSLGRRVGTWFTFNKKTRHHHAPS